MAVIDIKADPTKKDLRIFGALWLVFFVVLARMAFWSTTGIVVAAIVTTCAFVVSFAFNTDQSKRMQLFGVMIPVVLWSVWAFERWGSGGGGALAARSRWWVLEGTGAQWGVFIGVSAIAVVGGAAILASAKAGKAIYVGWMYAALPLGWTMSHIVLGVVFFGVFTPIGLALRLAGKDPMKRRFDRGAATYWEPHEQERETSRYFRQF